MLPLEEGKQHHFVTFSRRDFFGDIVFLDWGVRSADAELQAMEES